MKSVVVVLPTKNEEQTIRQVISGIQKLFKTSEQYELKKVLITDDSNDKTPEIAKELNAEIVFGGGRGLGLAMFKGLKHAANLNSDYILTVDSDGQTDLSELLRFMDALKNQEGDLILASRFQKKRSIKYKYPFINRMGIHALVRIINNSTNLSVTDSHGGIRAMRTDVAKKLEMVGHYTYVQETIMDAVEKGFHVHELASDWKERLHGDSIVLHSIPRYIAYTAPVLFYRGKFHTRYLFPLSLLLCFTSLVSVISSIFFESLMVEPAILVWASTVSGFLGFSCLLFSILFELLCTLIRESRHA